MLAILCLVAAGLISVGFLVNIAALVSSPKRNSPGQALWFTVCQVFFVVLFVVAAVHGVAAL